MFNQGNQAVPHVYIQAILPIFLVKSNNGNKQQGHFGGGRDCTVVRALASYQCCSGSIPRSAIICGLSFVGSQLCTEKFSSGTPVIPLLKHQHLI